MEISDKKCKICNSLIEITKETVKTEKIRVAQARLESMGGYFGETPDEYGAADTDLYKRYFTIRYTNRCAVCGKTETYEKMEAEHGYCDA